ncbi:MAG: heme biosynthesis HemY N-terminal domain-containing protein [Pseudomonadota bacterium]|nr:heme biosynthesis HemY N-terminal domain-containing protein [Pseudomonadota bacterium]
MLVRGIILFLCAAALGLITQNITSNPGDVVIVWQGYDIRFSTTVLCVALVCGLGGFFFAGYLFSWVKMFPKLLQARRGRKSEAKGLNYLFEAFESLSLGDAKEAQKAAHKSAAFLADTRLSRVVEAQALSHQGKADKAEALYIELAAEKKSQLAGLRGLLAQSIKEKNWHEAELLLESCQEEYPKNGWVAKQAMLIYLHQGAFYKAQDHLKLYLAHADDSEEEKQTVQRALALLKGEDAPKMVELANKKLGLTLPTALYHLNRLIDQKKWRAAFNFAGEMWKHLPHPMIYSVWVELMKKRYRKPDVVKQTLLLVQGIAETPEAIMLMAAAHLKSGNALKARQLLINLSEEHNYREVYDLLIEAERALNPHAKEVAQWTEKALNAPRLPQTYMESSHALYAWFDAFAAPIDLEEFSINETLKKLGAEEVLELDEPVTEVVVA